MVRVSAFVLMGLCLTLCPRPALASSGTSSFQDLSLIIVLVTLGSVVFVAAWSYSLKLAIRRAREKSTPAAKQEKSASLGALDDVVENEALFRGLFETSAAGMALLDMSGRYFQANDRFLDIVGYTAEELQSLTWRDLTHPDEIPYIEEMDRRIAEGEAQDFTTERRMLRKDGTVIWTSLSSAQLRDEAGIPTLIFSFIQDISKLKQAEQVVQENERNMRSLFDSGPVGVGVIGRHSNERLYINSHLLEMMGAKSADELTSRPLRDTYVRQEDFDHFYASMREESATRSLEVERKRLDGSTFWCLQSFQSIGKFQGQDACVVWLVDVSRLKNTEAELAAQKEITDITMDTMDQGLSMFGADLNLALCNRRFNELFDLPKELTQSGTPLETLFRFIAERGDYGEGVVEDQVRERLELARKFEPHSFHRVLADGRTLEVKGIPVPSGGFVTSYTDISSIVDAQRDAKLLQEALDTFADMLILYDKDERVVFTNDRYHEIYPNAPSKADIKGVTMEALLRRSLDAGLIKNPLAQSDPEAWLAQSLAARRDKSGGAGETTHSSGRTFYYRYAWTTEGGMILMQTDISERKEMEEALRQSEMQVRKILEDSPIAVAISIDDGSEEDGVIQFTNARFRQLLGFEESDVGNVQTSEFFGELSNRDALEETLDSGQSLVDMEVSIRTRDDGVLWTLMSISPLHYDNRKSALIWLYDISELKRTQQEIARKEAQLRMALDNMPGAMFVVDEDLDLVLVNDAYKRFYGDPDGLVHPGGSMEAVLRSEIARGMLVGDGSPEDILEERIGSFRVKELAVFEDVTADERYIQLSRKPAPGNHTVSVAIDVTERKLAEKSLADTMAMMNESLQYAARIQRSLLPSQSEMSAAFADHCVIWEPRDVVGGDIYLLRRMGEDVVLLVADCTGHGVPGAFMTMIVAGALDQSLADKGLEGPAAILQRMNQLVKTILGQEGQAEEGKSDDGFECSLCIVRPAQKDITFAGARMELWALNQAGVEVLKGDRLGLGYRRTDMQARFTEHAVPLQAAAKYYVLSDGVIDQIGGGRKRAFGKIRAKAELQEMHAQGLADTVIAFKDRFEAYRGEEHQRDDITLFGFSVLLENNA